MDEENAVCHERADISILSMQIHISVIVCIFYGHVCNSSYWAATKKSGPP